MTDESCGYGGTWESNIALDFHLDHMGIAQEIANCGVRIVMADLQKTHIYGGADRGLTDSFLI